MYTIKNLREDIYKISTTHYVKSDLLKDYLNQKIDIETFKSGLTYKEEYEINEILNELNRILEKLEQNGGKVDPDPVSEAYKLRKANRLKEAYQTILPYLQAYPQDEQANLCFGWIINDYLKQSEENIDLYCRFLEQLNRYAKFNLQSKEDSMINLFSSFLWSIRRAVLKEESNANKIAEHLIGLFRNTEGDIFKQSSHQNDGADPVRVLVKDILKKLDETNYLNLIHFIGFEWFSQSDYKPSVYTNKKGEQVEVQPLAEWILSYHAKKLLESDDVEEEEIQNFIDILSRESRRHPEFEWLPFYKIKLLIKMNRNREALSNLADFAKKKEKEFWIWDMISELVPEEEKLIYLCKGLLCKTKPEMLVGLQEKIIPYLLKEGLYANAKLELDLCMEIRTRKGWSISQQFHQWKNEEWYKKTPAAENRENLKEFAKKAKKIFYKNYPAKDIFITYINHEKRVVHFIYDVLFKGIHEGYFYMDSVDEDIDWKTEEVYAVKMAEDGLRPNLFRILDVSSANKVAIKSFIQSGNGIVAKKWEDDPFAFVENAYIHPKLVEQYHLEDGDSIEFVKKQKYDKRKKRWGWAVVEIKSVTKQ